jgi:hypothetical protein
MRTTHAAVQKVLDQIREFVAEYPAEMATLPVLEELAAVQATLNEDGVAQAEARNVALAGTQTRRELRQKLRNEHLVPLSRIVRSRVPGALVPKMEEFRVPSVTATDHTLITEAKAMAELAQEYWEVLRDFGIGQDFVDRLRAAIEAFHKSIISRDSHVALRTNATTALDLRMSRARRVIGAMTGIVEHQFASRPEIVREWRKRVRIPRKPGVPKGRVRPERPAEEVNLKIA